MCNPLVAVVHVELHGVQVLGHLVRLRAGWCGVRVRVRVRVRVKGVWVRVRAVGLGLELQGEGGG